jgi:signal transduction histidine kinase
MMLGDQVVGVLSTQSYGPEVYTSEDTLVLQVIASQAAIAIENARLYASLQQELAERTRAEGQLQRTSAELMESNEELKRFTYIVSHDLRAPLVNLKGFAVELRSALESTQPVLQAVMPLLDESQKKTMSTALMEDVPEAVSFIEASATRMDHFIHALLRLSRLGRREMTLEQIDMEQLVRDTLETLAHQIEQRQVTVTLGELPDVTADRTSIEQILGNILNNAIIYLETGRPGQINIWGECHANETVYHVRDNGRGIAPEDMDKVFAPFRRAGRQDVPGEGMGLTYVQALVRRHNGRIWCESQLGVGTTFHFIISNHLKGRS